MANKKQKHPRRATNTVRFGESEEIEHPSRPGERMFISMGVLSLILTGTIVWGVVKIVDSVVNRE